MGLSIRYNKKQVMLWKLLSLRSVLYVCAYGGARSGKTWLFLTYIIIRCFLYPGSKHLVVRFKRNSLHRSVWNDTFPKVLVARGLGKLGIAFNKTELSATFPNGSQIWFNGLNTDDAIEAVLGTEYATIYVNEASEIKKFVVVEKLMTRLNDSTVGIYGKKIIPKMIIDCNPPRKSHWIYKLFIKKVNPESGDMLEFPDEYACLQVNPDDNAELMGEGHLRRLQGLSLAQKKRFYYGEFTEEDVGKVYAREWLKYYDAGEDLRYLYVVQSWDTANKIGEMNDPSVGTTWGVRKTRQGKLKYDLLDCVVMKLTYPVLRDFIISHAKEWTADWVLIEDKASGQSLLQEIPALDKIRNYIPISVTRSSGDKYTRAQVSAGDFEAGIVQFPDKAEWLEKVEDQLLEFDEDADEDDIVDSISQFLNWARMNDFAAVGGGQEYMLDNYAEIEYSGWKNNEVLWRK